MKSLNYALLAAFFVLAAFLAPSVRAQTSAEGKTATPPQADTQKKNTQAYIDLLRKDIRQQKAEIMGSVMVLSAADAAKFWPIYSDYDAQLTKLGDQRVQIIKEYVDSYNDMTDAKADELVQRASAFQKQRAELLAQTYEKVKAALGGITAARFVMVEHQLLLIIDLQVDSALPIVGQAS